MRSTSAYVREHLQRTVARDNHGVRLGIAVDVSVVPELIGGVRVTANSRRLDATVLRKIEKLGTRLRAAL